jgi:flagellar protein FlaF
MPPLNQQPNNPYASAAGAYGTNAQKNANDPRELEARVLLKAAQYLQDVQSDIDNISGDDLDTVLKYNRAIWVMFLDNLAQNEGDMYPDDLRSNIANLANFIFKREIDILAKPEKSKLDVLININRNIAEGLMKGVKAAPIPIDENAGNNSTATANSENIKTDTSA